MKNKISLCTIFALVKFLNFFYVFTDRYGLAMIVIFLLLNKIAISFYIVFILFCTLVILKLSNRINNVLCISRLSHTICMNSAVNIRKLSGKNIKNPSNIYLLDKLVDEFIEGLSRATLNTKKFRIKEGKTYKFRTHGAIYILFEKKLSKLDNNVFIYDKDPIKKALHESRNDKLHNIKLSFSDKLTFIVERMLLQRSFSQMLKFFGHLNFNKIRVHNFEAVFKNKKIYLKVIE